MKKIIFLLLITISFSAFAQMPDIGTTKVRIADKDKVIVAEVNQVASLPKAKLNLFYYWYYANGIHATQGGFSGKLLDGQYDEYDDRKNLKEQGAFKKGLKTGTWKTWNEDGSVKEVTDWKNGVVVVKNPIPIWKRLPLLKRKKKQPAADTSHKTA